MFFAQDLKTINDSHTAMKKYLIITFAMLAIAICSFAQQPTDGKTRIEQQIRHYIALFELNQTEAQQFDELYKAYSKQLYSIRTRYRNEQDNPTPSDDELEQLILNNFAFSREILNAREQYYHLFRKILTPSQINTIFEDEKSRRNKIRENNSQK